MTNHKCLLPISQSLPLLALLLVATSALADDGLAPYHFVPEHGTTYELVTPETKLVTLGLASWGPDWNWFSFPNEPRVAADGARVLDVSRRIAGAGVDLRLAHRVAPDPEDPQALIIEHRLTAADDAPLTLIAFTLHPEPDAFSRLELQRPNGARERLALPLRGPRLAGEALAVRLLNDDESHALTFTFDRPRRVTSERRSLRIILARDAIEADAPAELVTRVRAPGRLAFHARAADAAQRTDTSDWFPYPVGQAGTPVDLSFLNKDADGEFIPAGSHGFLQVDGDRFVFEDGTEARFWGTNLTAAAVLSGGRRAQQLAERLARLGVNVVRLHHLDSWYNPIVDEDHPSGTTQHLNPRSMRNLDRLVFELKERGIYIILDPWVQRTFTEADNVASHDQLGSGNFHLHPYIFFDDRMRELHKQFMRQVWNHVNEHTGLAYKDDPAFILTGVANEALMQRSAGHVELEPYRTEFLRRYRRWAVEHGADPDAGERVITENWPRDHQRFYIHVMRDFYRDMHDFFRDEVGLRIPINASNWFLWHWEIVSQQDLDFMDAHHYYDGDQVGAGDGLGGAWLQHPPHRPDTPFGELAAMHLHNKPLLVSEVGHNPPKTYRAAYYPGLAAVAALQGWDAITPYAYAQTAQPAVRLSGRFQGAYEFEADPATIASMAAAALIYRRGDVQPAERSVLMHVDDDHIFDFQHSERAGEAFQNTGLFNALLETHRVSVHLGDELPEDVRQSLDRVITPQQAIDAYDPAQTQLHSDTRELWRDWERGIGAINTPRTQLAYGFLGRHKPVETADARFAIDTSFATVSLSSLSDEPLRRADRLLLTAVARAENTGMSYDLTGSRVIDVGEAPMIAEPVVGTVTLATDRAAYRLYPVRVDGSRGEAVEAPVRDGKARFELRADHRTLFYEIEAADDVE